MKRFRGLALIVTLGTCAPAALGAVSQSETRVRFEGDAVDIPFVERGGRSLVEVHVGDEGPFDFLVDTGAGVSVIDVSLVQSLGLETVGRVDVGAPGGPTVSAEKVRVPRLRVGPASFEGAEPVAIDLGKMTSGLIRGVLGMELFDGIVLTLDVSGKNVRLERGRLSPNEPGVIRVDTSGGRMAFDIDVAGTSVPAQIDTGAPGGFTLPIELMGTLPLTDAPETRGKAGLVGGERSIRIRGLDGSIRFAELSFDRPDVSFMDPSPGHANIGSAVLDELMVRIDRAGGLLAFTHPVAAGAPPPRRLGIRFGGAPGAALTQVAAVDPGSLGEAAGFRAGDEVQSLNGRAMTDYDMSALRTLIGGTTPLRWEVMRDGELHVIEVP